MSNRPRRRLLVAAVVAACLAAIVLAAYAFRGTVLTWVGGQLICAEPPVKSDAIVVLAGGTPGREIAAADLYLAGYAPRIAITREPEDPGLALLARRGVHVPEAIEERLRYLRELRVPPSAIETLGLVESTTNEASVVTAWARASGLRSVLVVTSAFHTCRARLAFRRAIGGAPLAVHVTSSASDRFTAATWWRNRVSLRNGLIEWQKLLLYRLHLE